MMNKVVTVQVSDTTGVDSKTKARKKNEATSLLRCIIK